MPVGLSEPVNLLPVEGIRLAAGACGIKKNGASDIVLIDICEGASSAGVFTQNAFCAAPVSIARAHLSAHMPRAMLINSGNANAGTGRAGLAAAMRSCQSAAQALQCSPQRVLPFSTGVIGEPLQVENIERVLPALVTELDSGNWLAAAEAIMTTDTVAKAVSRQLVIDGKTVTITGMAKGSGMIRPDMATMLAYVATDAQVTADALQQCLQQCVAHSFNAITVDGDTSTNDACMLIATARSGIMVDSGHETFMQALQQVFTDLAQAIVRDGEGASKFVTIEVRSADTTEEARRVAYTIAHSPLVKTALFASDPNWGRILAAVGRAGIDGLDIDAVRLWLDEVCIVEHGGRAESYTEALGQQVMDRSEITIRVELGRGQCSATVWTTDLSHDYVTINSEYRS